MKTIRTSPPRFFLKFFRWFCHPKLLKYIEGDLMELYLERIERRGKKIADLKFMMDVLLLCRPGIIRPAERHQNLNTYGMYKSYLKIGWRNLLRNKGYSLINIGGLAVGIGVVILIGLWVNDEMSFNTFHQNHDRIARVMRSGLVEDKLFTTHYLPDPLAVELRDKYGSDFKRVTRMFNTGDEIFAREDKKLTMKGAFMEPDGIEIFSIPLSKGNTSAFRDPNSIILSTSFAKAMFGDVDPINKTLTMRGSRELKVTGVYEKLPYNTEFHEVDFFAPYELFVLFNPWVNSQGFANNFLQVYVEIQPNGSFEHVSNHVKDAILNNVQDNAGYVAVHPQIFLHPMDRWHLFGDWGDNGQETGLVIYVKLFAITGAFILLLACINFMNLSTARSEKRAKEVGIRKSIGSLRKQLISQFLSESFLVVIIAFVVAMAIATLSLDGFNALASKQITMPWDNLYFWLACLIFILVTGIISGSYPAFYLSSFRPIQILKGTFRAGRMASVPRKILVVVQFTVSVIMIIGTSFVYRQIQHAKNRPVGYDREGLLMLPMLTGDHYEKYDVLKNELLRSGAATNVALSMGQTTEVNSSNGGFTWRGMKPGFISDFGTLWVSADYGKTVGWRFSQGRDFSDRMASDSSAMVMNASAAKLMGIENPVGEEILWEPTWDKPRTYHVIGVIEDMIMKSPYDHAMPVLFFLGNRVNVIDVRMNPSMNPSEALTKIESVLKTIITPAPFVYNFADQQYALKFANEERIGKLATVFAIIAILISCLGLFGLSSFVAEQKTKEIGIRKVVGASTFSLWKLLSKDFIVLVMIAAFIASPLAWYIMSDWLSAYQYRTTLSWWIFGAAVAGSLVLTLLTVSYQAIKAATGNPVQCLRSE